MIHNTLIIRADASPKIGAGHVMRCIGIAEEWISQGGHVHFVSSQQLPFTKKIITSLKNTKLTKTIPAEAQWVILDGYQFSDRDVRYLQSKGLKVLFVDDLCSPSIKSPDLILNTAPNKSYGHIRDKSRLLLGPEFVSVRNDIKNNLKPAFRNLKNILVTLGGSDLSINALPSIINGLEKSPKRFSVTFVLSDRIPRQLIDRIKSLPHAIKILSPTSNMVRLFQNADFVIAGGGSTCWDLAYRGIPFAFVQLAQNQDGLVKHIVQSGAGLKFTPNLLCQINVSSLKKMSDCGKKMVDGFGAKRVIMKIRGEKLWLRPATMADAKCYWKMANDVDVRKMTFHPKPILFKSHLKWFTQKLCSPHSLLLLAYDHGNNIVGQIRFDKQAAPGFFTVDVSLVANMRGKGLGRELIRIGTHQLFALRTVKKAIATVFDNNKSSLKSFLRAGYRIYSDEKIQGQMCHRLLFDSSFI